jgi:hypothetical protein
VEASCQSEDKTIQEHEPAHAAYDVLDDPPVRTAQQSPVRWTDGHPRIKRQKAASEAATEPAEPASQSRWS